MSKIQNIIIGCLVLVVFLFFTNSVSALVSIENGICQWTALNGKVTKDSCDSSKNLICKKSSNQNSEDGSMSNIYTCQKSDDPLTVVFGQIEPPTQILEIGIGSAGINNVINKIVQIIYVAAGIIFVFMIIISALQWIMSGGDKEAVGKARGRLTWAVIGIVFLALAFVIISVIGQITGFPFFVGQ